MRLSQGTRASITSALMVHRYSELLKQQKANEEKFADAVYMEIFSDKERRIMARLPAGWLAADLGFGVAFGGMRAYLKMSEARPFPAECVRKPVIKHFDAGHELSSKFLELQTAREALNKQRRQSEVDAERVLSSVRTTEKLLKIWPEIEPFIPSSAAPPANLPAVRIERLNEAFKLPVPKGKAA